MSCEPGREAVRFVRRNEALCSSLVWAVWRKETKRKLLFGGCNSVSVLSLKIDGKPAGQELK
jgi:hypothetical protein